jgi:hypothetical protein
MFVKEIVRSYKINKEMMLLKSLIKEMLKSYAR